jgi:WD40 repeat protein
MEKRTFTPVANSCEVTHVSFHEDKSLLRLQTVCNCGLICHWSLFPLPPTLLQEIRLDPNKEPMKWSEDGSKCVTREGLPSSQVYSLWRKGIPGQYRYLLERDWSSDDYWVFSPGSGNTLACSRESLLNVWDCMTIKPLFSKEFDRIVDGVEFDPNAEVILVGDRKSIHCISSKDGTVIWLRTMPLEGQFTFTFFFHGKKVAVHNREGVDIVSLADGSTLVDRYSLPDAINLGFYALFAHPED